MRKILLTLLAIGGLALTAAAQDSGELRDHLTVTGWGQTYYDAAFGPDVRGTNTFAINKINLVAKGQITDRWSMGILFQMHSPAKLKELWLQYTLMPQLRVRIGEMKTPFGMENQIPPSLLPLTSGWTMPTCYFAGVSGDPLYRGTSGRDIGLELSGDLWGKILSYKLAVMNGQGLNTLDLGTTKMYGGALYVRPYSGITLHTSYLGGEMHAMGTRGAIQAGDAYKRSSVSAGLSLDYSPVTLSAEYLIADTDETIGDGAYVMVVGHLPKSFELYGAVDWLRTDRSASESLLTGTVGVQRWFAKKCRWQLEYRFPGTLGSDEGFGPTHHIRTQVQFGF